MWLSGRGDGLSVPESSSKANVRERHICVRVCTFRLDVFFSFLVAVVEGHDSEDDYEKIDDEKMEGACRETDDNDYEGSLRGESFVRTSSGEEEEADYINLTLEQNVQVVDITGDNESDYENVTLANEEELIYIYGEVDDIYQNMDQSDLRRQNTPPSSDEHLY